MCSGVLFFSIVLGIPCAIALGVWFIESDHPYFEAFLSAKKEQQRLALARKLGNTFVRPGSYEYVALANNVTWLKDRVAKLEAAKEKKKAGK